MTEQNFLELIDTHQRVIHKICRLYRDTNEDREDLFQEIVFQLWRSLPSFESRSSFTTWMYRIALNTALTAFRKKRQKIEFPGELPDAVDNSNEDYYYDQQELVFGALKQLNDSDKAIMALYLEGLSYEEIGSVAGMTANNIGVRINRIKTKIQTLLNLK